MSLLLLPVSNAAPSANTPYISKQGQAPAQRVHFNAENSQEECRKTAQQSQIHHRLASAHHRVRGGRGGGQGTWLKKKNMITMMKWKGLLPYSTYLFREEGHFREKHTQTLSLDSLTSAMSELVKFKWWLSSNESFIGACKSLNYGTILQSRFVEILHCTGNWTLLGWRWKMTKEQDF